MAPSFRLSLHSRGRPQSTLTSAPPSYSLKRRPQHQPCRVLQLGLFFAVHVTCVMFNIMTLINLVIRDFSTMTFFLVCPSSLLYPVIG